MVEDRAISFESQAAHVQKVEFEGKSYVIAHMPALSPSDALRNIHRASPYGFSLSFEAEAGETDWRVFHRLPANLRRAHGENEGVKAFLQRYSQKYQQLVYANVAETLFRSISVGKTGEWEYSLSELEDFAENELTAHYSRFMSIYAKEHPDKIEMIRWQEVHQFSGERRLLHYNPIGPSSPPEDIVWEYYGESTEGKHRFFQRHLPHLETESHKKKRAKQAHAEIAKLPDHTKDAFYLYLLEEEPYSRQKIQQGEFTLMVPSYEYGYGNIRIVQDSPSDKPRYFATNRGVEAGISDTGQLSFTFRDKPLELPIPVIVFSQDEKGDYHVTDPHVVFRMQKAKELQSDFPDGADVIQGLMMLYHAQQGEGVYRIPFTQHLEGVKGAQKMMLGQIVGLILSPDVIRKIELHVQEQLAFLAGQVTL